MAMNGLQVALNQRLLVLQTLGRETSPIPQKLKGHHGNGPLHDFGRLWPDSYFLAFFSMEVTKPLASPWGPRCV